MDCRGAATRSGGDAPSLRRLASLHASDVKRGECVSEVRGTFPALYELRVEGRLEPRSAAWFEGMTLVVDEGEGADRGTQTIVRGSVRDQAALFGLVSRIRDLGLTLVSVHRLDESRRDDGGLRHIFRRRRVPTKKGEPQTCRRYDANTARPEAAPR